MAKKDAIQKNWVLPNSWNNRLYSDPLKVPAQSPPSPSYTPLKKASFDSLTANATANGADGYDSPVVIQAIPSVSAAIAGPFGGGKVARLEFTAVGQHVFGGGIYTPAITVNDGTELWVRMYEYFPAGWNWGGGSVTETAWGATKWLRLWFSDGSDNCFQTGNNGHTWGMTTEGYGSAQNLTLTSPPAIPLGQWVCREYYVYHHATNGYIRCWQDGVYLGQVNGRTKPAGTLTITKVEHGNYWNGGVLQPQFFYADEFVVTTQMPDATDSGGRPMIGAARKVSDFV